MALDLCKFGVSAAKSTSTVLVNCGLVEYFFVLPAYLSDSICTQTVNSAAMLATLRMFKQTRKNFGFNFRTRMYKFKLLLTYETKLSYTYRHFLKLFLRHNVTGLPMATHTLKTYSRQLVGQIKKKIIEDVTFIQEHKLYAQVFSLFFNNAFAAGFTLPLL